MLDGSDTGPAARSPPPGSRTPRQRQRAASASGASGSAVLLRDADTERASVPAPRRPNPGLRDSGRVSVSDQQSATAPYPKRDTETTRASYPAARSRSPHPAARIPDSATAGSTPGHRRLSARRRPKIIPPSRSAVHMIDSCTSTPRPPISSKSICTS